MSEDMPAVSVIIPTHNRHTVLLRTLAALGAQTYPLQHVEIIVVADGCTDQTVEMLQHYRAPFVLRVIEQPAQGPAAARNCGATHAIGGVLLFLDDDIQAAPCLIEAHVRAHQEGIPRAVVGYLPLAVPQGRVGFLCSGMRGWWEDRFYAMRQAGYRYTYRDLLSGNFSLPAHVFSAVGGFDPTFRCHEDYELGMRLIKARVAFSFAADAWGYHHQTTDLNYLLQRKYQEGKADVLMGRRHPELRPALLVACLEACRLFPNRMLRALAFKWPAAGDAITAPLQQALTLVEWSGFRMPWRRCLQGLLSYWYWRGVAAELGTPRALASFLQGGPARADNGGNELELDLRDGLAEAERRLDLEQPAGVLLRYGQQFVGRLPPQVGAEPLRGVHLRAALATTLAQPLLAALAMEGAVDAGIGLALLFASREQVHCPHENTARLSIPTPAPLSSRLSDIKTEAHV